MQAENEYLNKFSTNPCNHESKYLFGMKPNFQICFNCSSIIYTNEIGKKFFQ